MIPQGQVLRSILSNRYEGLAFIRKDGVEIPATIIFVVRKYKHLVRWYVRYIDINGSTQQEWHTPTEHELKSFRLREEVGQHTQTVEPNVFMRILNRVLSRVPVIVIEVEGVKIEASVHIRSPEAWRLSYIHPKTGEKEFKWINPPNKMT